MAAVIAALPAMHLVCNIVILGGSGFRNDTYIASNQSPPRIQPSLLPDGYVIYPDIGVAYKVSEELVSWYVAKEKCAQDHGHLAVIDSALKIQLVRSQKHEKNRNELTHVGIYLMDGFENWLGSKTGLPMSSVPWAHGEPSGTGRCAAIKHGEGGLGKFSCITPGDYVCELPIPEARVE